MIMIVYGRLCDGLCLICFSNGYLELFDLFDILYNSFINFVAMVLKCCSFYGVLIGCFGEEEPWCGEYVAILFELIVNT